MNRTLFGCVTCWLCECVRAILQGAVTCPGLGIFNSHIRRSNFQRKVTNSPLTFYQRPSQKTLEAISLRLTGSEAPTQNGISLFIVRAWGTDVGKAWQLQALNRSVEQRHSHLSTVLALMVGALVVVQHRMNCCMASQSPKRHGVISMHSLRTSWASLESHL